MIASAPRLALVLALLGAALILSPDAVAQDATTPTARLPLPANAGASRHALVYLSHYNGTPATTRPAADSAQAYLAFRVEGEASFTLDDVRSFFPSIIVEQNYVSVKPITTYDVKRGDTRVLVAMLPNPPLNFDLPLVVRGSEGTASLVVKDLPPAATPSAETPADDPEAPTGAPTDVPATAGKMPAAPVPGLPGDAATGDAATDDAATDDAGADAADAAEEEAASANGRAASGPAAPADTAASTEEAEAADPLTPDEANALLADARAAIDASALDSAYTMLDPFLGDGSALPSGFLQRGRYLLGNIADSLVDDYLPRVQELQSEASDLEKSTIDDALAFADSVQALQDSLSAYLALDIPRAEQARANLDILESDARSIAQNVQQNRWRDRITFLVTGGHDDPTFRLYIKALAQVMMYRPAAYAPVTPAFDSLHTDALDRLPVRDELLAAGQLEDFRETLDALDDHLRRTGRPVPQNVMDNLKGTEVIEERQAYAHLFAAFDALASGDAEAMQAKLDKVYREATDLDFIERLDRWRQSFRLASAGVPSEALAALNEGVRRWDAGDGAGAEAAFKRAATLAPAYAPTAFYCGLARVSAGDPDAGVAAFREAVAADSQYLAPRIRIAQALVEAREHEHALAEIDSTLGVIERQAYDAFVAETDTSQIDMTAFTTESLESNTNWMAQFLRARSAFALHKRAGVADTTYLNIAYDAFERCRSLQKEHFELRMLYGDFWRARGREEDALVEYEQAYRLEPADPRLIERVPDIDRVADDSLLPDPDARSGGLNDG